MNHFITLGWIDIAVNVLLVFHVAVCLLLCLVVMMQRPKQEGLGAAFGGGMTDQAFGARTTDVLQKGTVFLGTIFFIITFALAVMIGSAGNDQREERNTEANKAAQKDDPKIMDEVNKENKESETSNEDKQPEGETTPAETPEKPEENKSETPKTEGTATEGQTDTPQPETPKTESGQ